MSQKPMKYVAYCRKSTSGLDENGVEKQEGSFERQKFAIEDYARRQGFVISDWYIEAVSGKARIEKRKVFKQMYKDGEAGKFNVVIFDDYTRFMRDNLNAMRYEVLFDDLGIELHFTDLQNDGSAMEEQHKSGQRTMAAQQSKEQNRRVVGGMLRKANMGSWLGGAPPYGYRTQRINDENGKAKIILVVEESEAKVIKEIFDLSLKGNGHKRIAILLNNKGVPSSTAARKRKHKSNKNPDGLWPASSVRMILSNRVYRGDYIWNKTARVEGFDWKKTEENRFKDTGKLRSRLPEFKRDGKLYSDMDKPQGEWIIKEGVVPFIVEPEVFDAVQARFVKYKNEGSKKFKRNNNKYLMSGALTCTCGNRLHGHRYSKILERTKIRAYYPYYRCSGDTKKGVKHGESKKPMIKCDSVDSLVKARIMSRIESYMGAGMEDIERSFEDRLKDYLQSKPNKLIEVDAELRKIEKEIDRIIDAHVAFDRPIPKEKVGELKERKAELDAERAKLIDAGEENISVDIKREASDFWRQVREAKSILESDDTVVKTKIRDSFLKSADVKWASVAGGRPEVALEFFKLPQLCGLGQESPAPPISFIE